MLDIAEASLNFRTDAPSMNSSSVLIDDRQLTSIAQLVCVGQLAIGGIFTNAVIWFPVFVHSSISVACRLDTVLCGNCGFCSSSDLEQHDPIMMKVKRLRTR